MREMGRQAARRDLLDIAMDMVDEQTGARMDDDQLRALVFTFLFAGHETTGVSMSWTLYELAKCPKIQEKIRKEANEVLGDGTYPLLVDAQTSFSGSIYSPYNWTVYYGSILANLPSNECTHARRRAKRWFVGVKEKSKREEKSAKKKKSHSHRRSNKRSFVLFYLVLKMLCIASISEWGGLYCGFLLHKSCDKLTFHRRRASKS